MKILGIVLLIFAATVGGAALRLKEVFFSPNVLSLSRSEGDVASMDSEGNLVVPAGEAPTIASARGTVNVLVVGLDNVDGGSRTDPAGDRKSVV